MVRTTITIMVRDVPGLREELEKLEVSNKELAMLGRFIRDEIPGEPKVANPTSTEESTADCAIRLLRAAYVK